MRLLPLFLLLLFLQACGGKPSAPNGEGENLPTQMLKDPDLVEVVYPETKADTTKDVFFGTTIHDPYRWLEGADTTLSKERQEQIEKERQQWMVDQNKVARNYLHAIPLRRALIHRLRELWNFERYGLPFKEGDFYYFYKNDGMQNQSVLYQTRKLEDAPTVFIDPNTLSKDGTAALQGVHFSRDGKYAAYGISQSGSDWKSVQILNTETRQLLPDKVDWLRYSGVSWYKDGFYYSRYPSSEQGQNKFTVKNEFHEVYYHKLGTNQDEDELIYADRQNPKYKFNAVVTDDEKLLLIYASETTSGNALMYKRLDVENSELEVLVSDFLYDFSVVDNYENKLLVYTNYKAPNYQLIEIDLAKPQTNNWRTLLPNHSKKTLKGVSLAGNQLAIQYIENVRMTLSMYDRKGKFLYTLPMPDSFGSITGVSSSHKETQLFYSYTAFTHAGAALAVDLNTRAQKVWKQPKIDFPSDNYVTRQTTYASKDGTRIPIYIIHKKGIQLDGSNPTLLYGYGGFNIPILPSFSIERLPLLENGGVYAVANLRGGGEFGKDWHDGGRMENKQNVFDDFIAAAEFLISEGYTSKQKLAIEGRSNGGLLVGACMTQRPDLFRVAVPIVGVLDMLRYHRFTIGGAWASDYGLSEDSTQFANLLKYSPLHNIRKENYPATLVMTAEYDDRVVPAHSFKFGAALQTNNSSKHPILLRIDLKAGHGAGKPTEKAIEEAADKLSFILFNLGFR